jgi:hypothetical protein
MTLTVEDGTGKADAESYISVADADTYFTARNNATWAALSTSDKEAALRKATDYMLQAYRVRWAGMRETEPVPGRTRATRPSTRCSPRS